MQDYAILCPGQGSQSPDMFELVAADPRGREVLEEASDTLAYDVLAKARSGDGLFDNAFAQPAMVALARATWALLEPQIPTPALFAGYSVGEVSAWSCAGAWDVRLSVAVAVARARIMDAHSPPNYGMLAARGLPLERLLAHATGLHLAIVNDVDHAVLAGADAALGAAEATLASHGAWTRRLGVHVPSHTPVLKTAASKFGAFLATTPSQPVSAPVLRGVDGRRCLQSSEAPQALQRAVCEPIRWDDCMREIVESGVRVVLDLGPGRALANLCSQAHPQLTARSVADFRSARGVVDWLHRQVEA
ncbi:MAG: acyltransferase domain-containing protein [Methylibium sp.]|uniref:acyltransferase domain-containing protein n=1 Tax=Methylibium sp. TaxID=2067992 RepID=UPI0018239E96|nr:acyltransferase domain-containing protein [Methylibium sp.]MBA3595966.1 acyltransferase domain-containing protein [Methylibium sp.]